MATLEDLQQQLQLLKAQIDALTTPPNEYYTLLYSGEEVDELLGREGSGTVKTVAGVGPDDDGNVPLTASSVKAAPDGYGLGGGGTVFTDCNAAVNSGWYNLAAAENGPSQSFYGWLLVSSRSGRGGMIRQDAWSATSTVIHYIRYAVNGGWKDWETVNPAMALGIEYRTAEMYNGRPVYVKLVDFGALPNSTSKAVQYSNDTSCRPISVSGTWDNQSNTMPIESGSSGFPNQLLSIGALGQNIIITTHSDYSSYTAYALVKYWKTTD